MTFTVSSCSTSRLDQIEKKVPANALGYNTTNGAMPEINLKKILSQCHYFPFMTSSKKVNYYRSPIFASLLLPLSKSISFLGMWLDAFHTNVLRHRR